MGLRFQYTRHVVPPQTEGPEGCPQPSPYSVHVGITNSFGVMLGRSSQEIQAVKDWVEAVQSPLHFSNSLDKSCSQIVSFMTLRMARWEWWPAHAYNQDVEAGRLSSRPASASVNLRRSWPAWQLVLKSYTKNGLKSSCCFFTDLSSVPSFTVWGSQPPQLLQVTPGWRVCVFFEPLSTPALTWWMHTQKCTHQKKKAAHDLKSQERRNWGKRKRE